MATPEIDIVHIEVRWFHATEHQPATRHGIITHDGAILDSTFNEIAATIPGCPTHVERFVLSWAGWMAIILDASNNRAVGSLHVHAGAGA